MSNTDSDKSSGYKVFVSYKYGDTHVKKIGEKGTVRDYVDYLQENHFSGNDLNKAEKDGEDLSEFADETIWTTLKDKIWDSSITILLISKEMKEKCLPDADQWIPWEISYSLKEISRDGRQSHSNGILAVVLPDEDDSYEYFLTNWTYQENGEEHVVTTIHTDITFNIVRNNMFNAKNPVTRIIYGSTVYFGNCSYIPHVKWDEFLENIDFYLGFAADNRDTIDDFEINKEV